MVQVDLVKQPQKKSTKEPWWRGCKQAPRCCPWTAPASQRATTSLARGSSAPSAPPLLPLTPPSPRAAASARGLPRAPAGPRGRAVACKPEGGGERLHRPDGRGPRRGERGRGGARTREGSSFGRGVALDDKGQRPGIAAAGARTRAWSTTGITLRTTISRRRRSPRLRARGRLCPLLGQEDPKIIFD